jgi:hypothetical protein
VRFPYTPPRPGVGPLDYLPFLPIRLVNGQTHVSVVDLVENYPPVPLTFAWSQLPGAPLILGQFNFLFAFDACFYRSRAEFEVRPRP